MKNQFLNHLVGAMLLSGIMTISSAYAANCEGISQVNGSTTYQLLTSDVSFRNNDSDNCNGYNSGNDSLADVNSITLFPTSGLFGGGWQAMARDNTDSNSDTVANFLGIEWSLTDMSNVNSGNWTLNVNDTGLANLPVIVDLMAVLKGGPGWAAYLFTGEIFTTSGDSTGRFNIQFHNVNGQGEVLNSEPGLSHLSVYLRGRECNANDNCGGGGGTGTSIPEPAQLALMGIGFLGMALARRNSRRA